jgi:nucleoside-diphosphate-sugar epimerase
VASLQAVAGPRPAPIRRIIAVKDTQEPVSAPEPSEDEPASDPAVQWCSATLSSPLVAAALAGAEIVVHVAAQDQISAIRDPMQRRAHAVRSAQAVTTAAAAIGARRLIAVTSAMVFGARPDNPIPLDDACIFRAEPDDGVAGDLLEVERVLERIPRVHPGLACTLIRPAALVGPGVDTAVTRHFLAPRLLVLRGQAMSWQFCHLDDLASAVLAAVQQDLGGQLTVASPGVLEEAAVERISGIRRLEVPSALAFSTAERLHKVGVLPSPASELAFVVHPWAVSTKTLTDVGWTAKHDNEACLRVLLDALEGRPRTGRHVGRRDAAMGAAGAAVALVGTAAILRQARSRRGRRHPPRLES